MFRGCDPVLLLYFITLITLLCYHTLLLYNVHVVVECVVVLLVLSGETRPTDTSMFRGCDPSFYDSIINVVIYPCIVSFVEGNTPLGDTNVSRV